MRWTDTVTLAVVGVAAASSTPVLAAQAPAMKVHPITEGRLYWVEGGGPNSGVIIGDRGVIVIDAKGAPDTAQQMQAEIAKLTPKPITHIIVTHSDGDHINGLAGFPDGLKIISHVNTKSEWQAVYLSAAVEVDGGRCLPPANRIPNQLIMRNRVATTIDGVKLVFHNFGPAHTTGDLVVEIPGERTAFVGDLLTSSVLIHPEKAGSLEGWFTSAKAMLGLNVVRYIGGHTPGIDTKDTIRKRMADYQSIRDKVDGLVAQGLPLAEVKKAMGDPEKEPAGCRGIPRWSIAELQYHYRTNLNNELK